MADVLMSLSVYKNRNKKPQFSESLSLPTTRIRAMFYLDEIAKKQPNSMISQIWTAAKPKAIWSVGSKFELTFIAKLKGCRIELSAFFPWSHVETIVIKHRKSKALVGKRGRHLGIKKYHVPERQPEKKTAGIRLFSKK